MDLYCETPDPATFTAVWLGKDIEFAVSLARDIAAREAAPLLVPLCACCGTFNCDPTRAALARAQSSRDEMVWHMKSIYANVNARAMPKFVTHWKDWGTCPAGAD